MCQAGCPHENYFGDCTIEECIFKDDLVFKEIEKEIEDDIKEIERIYNEIR